MDERALERTSLDGDSNRSDSETNVTFGHDSTMYRHANLCDKCTAMWSAFWLPRELDTFTQKFYERSDFLSIITNQSCSLCIHLIGQLDKALLPEIEKSLVLSTKETRVVYSRRERFLVIQVYQDDSVGTEGSITLRLLLEVIPARGKQTCYVFNHCS